MRVRVFVCACVSLFSSNSLQVGLINESVGDDDDVVVVDDDVNDDDDDGNFEDVRMRRMKLHSSAMRACSAQS